MLLAREVPPTGGDTLFASCTRAFSTLSEGMQQMLLTLRPCTSRHVFGAQAEYMDAMEGRLGNAEAATQDAVHPWLFVIRCPVDRLCMLTPDSRCVSTGGRTKSLPLLTFL